MGTRATSKAAKKLRRSQAQAKKLVKKRRLVSAWILPLWVQFQSLRLKTKSTKIIPAGRDMDAILRERA
jgi:hypothetical protein